MFSNKSIKKYIILISLLILTIIFSGCSSVENPIIPPFPEAEEEPIELIVPETTKVIDPVTEQEIISIASDHSQIVFKKSTPQLENLSSGDIIVMGMTEKTPYGLLRKVKTVTKGLSVEKGENEIILKTEPATLEEAIKKGQICFNKTIEIAPILINHIIYDEDKNPDTKEDNIYLKGSIILGEGGYLEVDYCQTNNDGLEKVYFNVDGKIITQFNLIIGSSISVNISSSLLKDILHKPVELPSFTVLVAGIPVVITPEFDIKIALKGVVKSEFSASITRTDHFIAGLEYNRSGPNKLIGDHNENYGPFEIETSTDGLIELSIGPELSIKLMGTVAPYLDGNFYANVSADIYKNPWWIIKGGFKVHAGLKFDILKIISWKPLYFKVIDINIILGQADGPYGGTNHAPVISSLIANPSNIGINQVTTIKCIASDPDDDSLTYTWTKTGGTFIESTSEAIVTWRAPSTSDTYTVMCGVTDGHGGEATKSVDISVSNITPINQAPYIPNTPNGPSSGKAGTSYSFSTYTTDPDGDNIAYIFDWGDGNISNWTSYVLSGNIVNQLHSYSAKGTYYIKTKAKDINGAESLWSNSHKITIDLEITEPVAPNKLSATTLSQNNIALVWQDNSNNENGFKIERKTGTTGTFMQIVTIGATVGTGSGVYYEDSGLTPGTSYCYRVRAYNSAGSSSYSNETCATTAPIAPLPSATTGSATNITFNSVTLNGTVNPNGVETGAFFQWGTTTSYGNLTDPQLLGSGTSNVNISTNLTGLSSNTTYHFRIVANNSNSGTIFGEDRLFITTHGTQNVTLVLYICENSTSGPPLSGVSVGVVDGGGNSSNHITNSSGYVTITGIPGTWHFSAIKSGYETNNWSQPITTNCTKYGYIKSNITTSPPTGLSVSSYWNTTPPGFPSMVLSWNAVSGATGYEMWVRPAGGSSAYLGTRDAPYVTFNSNSLPGGTRYVSGITYYFKVRTVTESSTSAFTSEVPCIAASAPPPSLGQVQLLVPSNGGSLPPMNVTFWWNPVSNATKYQFILYNPKGQIALDKTISTTSIIVTLGTEETITWKVRAGDNSGNWGPWSSIWSLNIKSLI